MFLTLDDNDDNSDNYIKKNNRWIEYDQPVKKNKY